MSIICVYFCTYMNNEMYVSNKWNWKLSFQNDTVPHFTCMAITFIFELDEGGMHCRQTRAWVLEFSVSFFRQQDAQEFLRYLLEGLHEDVNRVTSKPKPVTIEDDDFTK